VRVLNPIREWREFRKECQAYTESIRKLTEEIRKTNEARSKNA
jgi:hypothetical protein